MSRPTGAPPVLSRKARRAFKVLGEELKDSKLLHHILLYDPENNGCLTLHTFEDATMLERNLRHIADRIRSGEHQRTRQAVDPAHPDHTPDTLQRAIRRALREPAEEN